MDGIRSIPPVKCARTQMHKDVVECDRLAIPVTLVPRAIQYHVHESTMSIGSQGGDTIPHEVYTHEKCRHDAGGCGRFAILVIGVCILFGNTQDSMQAQRFLMETLARATGCDY